jgi:hypothetical protein
MDIIGTITDGCWIRSRAWGGRWWRPESDSKGVVAAAGTAGGAVSGRLKPRSARWVSAATISREVPFDDTFPMNSDGMADRLELAESLA